MVHKYYFSIIGARWNFQRLRPRHKLKLKLKLKIGSSMRKFSPCVWTNKVFARALARHVTGTKHCRGYEIFHRNSTRVELSQRRTCLRVVLHWRTWLTPNVRRFKDTSSHPYCFIKITHWNAQTAHTQSVFFISLRYYVDHKKAITFISQSRFDRKWMAHQITDLLHHNTHNS